MTGEFLAGCIVGGICGFAIGLVCGIVALGVLVVNPPQIREGKSDG